MLPVSPLSLIWGFHFGFFDSLCPDMFTWRRASNWSKADRKLNLNTLFTAEGTAPSVRLGFSLNTQQTRCSCSAGGRRGERATDMVVTWDLPVSEAHEHRVLSTSLQLVAR